MKLLLFFAAWALTTAVHAQDTTIKKDLNINVPDFANAETKKFYTAYSAHLLKCIQAIRTKDEAAVMALFKAGESMVTQEKALAQKVVKDPVEKKKYLQFATDAYPYIKELERSTFYQKLSLQKNGKG